MGRLSGPRHRLAGLAFLLALGVGLVMTVPALADYLGPDRTVTTWEWRRLQCHYEAVYNPPGAGWYGCTLDLYDTPDSNCPTTGDVAGYFTPSACSWPSDFCQSPGCSISLSASVGGCSEGETGCRAVEKSTTLPEATVSGSLSCAVPGAGGWCLAGADLSLTGSEPLAAYTILALEGTRNGETFACPGAACDVPLVEGTNDFAFWAISSWGDTSLMGSASGKLDTHPPVISGEISGATGDNGWYLSDVAFSASASDPSPGSGLSGLEVSLDGGAWTAYTGPLTLSDGSHTVELRAGDTAGNMSTQSPTVRVDTQPPGLDLIANDFFCPGCGEPLDVAVDVQDAGSGVVEWTLSADAGLVASGSGPTSQVLTWDGSGLPGGPYTLSLRARDAAGNTSESSLAVNLLVPTPAPPPAELPPAETPPGSGPIWSTAVQHATPTAVPTATRPSLPTRTPDVIPFGGVPAVPLGEGGEEPRSNPPAEILGGPQPSVPGPSSGVLWGGAALVLIGAATAIALDQARRRREEEAREREEMERRNAAQRAREEAERARIAAAAAARAQQMQVSPDYGAIVGAALGAVGAEERIRAAQDRRVERREEEMEAAEQAARERAAAEAVRQAEEAARAAAEAQAERLREIAEGREEDGIQSRPTEPGDLPFPWNLTYSETTRLLRQFPSVRGPSAPVRTPLAISILSFGLLELGAVRLVTVSTAQSPAVRIGADGRSLGVASEQPPGSASVSDQGLRWGQRSPQRDLTITIPVDSGRLEVFRLRAGYSAYIGYRPGGFLNSILTLDVNLIDVTATVGGGQVTGQWGLYAQIRPWPILAFSVVAVAALLTPWPDEWSLPALLELLRRVPMPAPAG